MAVTSYICSMVRACWCCISVATLTAISSAPAFSAEPWKPSRPVTFIVPNAPAGTSDRTAREIQRIILAHRFLDVPITIVNRPGGNGTIALNQLRATPGDGHVFLIMNGATLSAQITGLTPLGHADFTPIALMVDEYFGVNVRPDSSVRSALDMLERLRKSPDALTFGSASITGNNYLSMLTALKKGGVEVKRLKSVSFSGGGQITMALLGGHIDVISTGLSNMAEHLQQGKMRTLVITGPRRMWGPFADVPTWREVGVDAVASGWRGVLGAKDLTPAQVGYWESVFRKVIQTDEWKQELRDNYWVSTYVSASDTRRRLDEEYAELKQILNDLGMARVK
jgi:putative tricarboxylic transport membrane protein